MYLCSLFFEYYASVNSKCHHPPGQSPGKFFEVVKRPAPGENFSAKVRPPGQVNTYPRGVFWNASNQWIPTIYQLLIQTRITSELCHKPAFSDGTYLNHQDYTTTFLSLYKIRYVKVLCTIKYQVYPTPHTHCHDNTGHFTLPCLQPT